MKLYHGSNTYIESELIPHKSFHYEPLVYATTDLYYALVRAGRFDINNFLLKEDYDGEIITLVELKEGAFIEAFNTYGFIYEVDDKSFCHTEECMQNEYISREPCKIMKKSIVTNVLRAMHINKKHFKLIQYGSKEADDYWKTVRGGREGYLKRRKERVERLGEDCSDEILLSKALELLNMTREDLVNVINNEKETK